MSANACAVPIITKVFQRQPRWQVCWLGGWDKHRHFYLVMLVKVAFNKPFTNRPVPN
jgi:hypothetical protein